MQRGGAGGIAMRGTGGVGYMCSEECAMGDIDEAVAFLEQHWVVGLSKRILDAGRNIKIGWVL